MMNYLYWYFVVGAAVLLLIFIPHRISQAYKTETKTDWQYAFYPKQKTLLHRLLNNFVLPVLACLALAIVWPIPLYVIGKGIFEKRTEAAREKENEFAVKRADLLQQMTIEEIEQLEWVRDPMGAVPDLPFGHINSAWKKLLDGLEPQDAIWTFSTNWTPLWGHTELRAGYVAVRKDSVGSYFLTTKKTIDENRV